MQGRSFSSPVVGKFCPHAVEKFCLPYGLPINPLDLEMTFLGFQWSMTSHVGYVVDNSVVVVVCGVVVLFLAFCACGGRWSEGVGGWLVRHCRLLSLQCGGLGLPNVPMPRWPRDDWQP